MGLEGFTGMLLGGWFAGSVLLLAAVVAGWRPTRRGHRVNGRRGGGVLWGPRARGRILAAVVAGAGVGVVTRWPVAVAAAAAVIWAWPALFGGGKAAAAQVERIEALATWAESLRDSISGAVGMDDAIMHSERAAPPLLRPALGRLAGRIRAQVPLTEALAGFAEEFDDASADLVIAVLILNAKLRGPGLAGVLGTLATSAREEAAMRRRAEEGRKTLRRTASIIAGSTGVFAAGMVVFSRDYVAPYSAPLGQVVLAVVFAVSGAGLVWIRAAANPRPPEPFLVKASEVGAALHPGATTTAVGGAR